MRVRGQSLGSTLREQRRAKRQSGGQRFCEGNHVRADAGPLIREMAARASQAALDLIGDQQRVRAGRQFPSQPEKAIFERNDAALSQYRFQHDSSRLLRERLPEPLAVIWVHESDVLSKGLKRLLETG